tara:strand:+ start:3589 stop:5082 length:1494 start_codon:yes stop_codon:yes gene_type:complete
MKKRPICSKIRCVSVVLASTLAGAGCSLVYDDDVFASADAFVPVEPALLVIESVEPTQVSEGVGANEFARATPIVVYGKGITDGARIRVVGAGVDLETAAQVSSDGTMAAAAIRLPVDREFAFGETKEISITLSQPAAATEDGGEGETAEASIEIDAIGLDEFRPAAGTLAVTDIAALYSEITIDAAINLVGNVPARFVATSSISVTAAVRADATGGERVAGGFLGGGPAQNGLGPSGGGRGAQGFDNAAGGGGGGNLEQGTAGQGQSAGDGGDASTATLLFPLTGVVGSGGGGGGNGVNGGSGGGAIEFRSSGPVTLGTGGLISANGSAGGASSCGILAGTGGGGGGSAGAILLRSESSLTIAAGVSLSVAGGAGGDGGGNCGGGDGSDGQIRIDYESIEGSASGAPRGPTWISESLPTIVRAAEVSATLGGAIGATYFLSVNAAANPTQVLMASNAEDVSLTLEPGINSVCALVASNGNLGAPESLTCVSVAYLP